MKPIYTLALLTIFVSCAPDAQDVIDKSIEAHGGGIYQNLRMDFDFRDRSYGVLRNNNDFMYVRMTFDSVNFYRDVLNNAGFYREIDGKKINLSSTDSTKYANSVNSVLYFALLPFALNDPAVQKKYLGMSTIDGEEYYKIAVSFKKEGGGKDHEDEFIYWIGEDDYLMDYFAYNYSTDGGGRRFRKAINQREVNGIVVADYINFSGGETFSPINSIENEYANGELKELSQIVLKNVIVHNQP